MLIKRIKLSNFKNFDDVEISLGKMNVVVGANASGKSNFIQALKFIKDIKEFGIDNAISLMGGIEYLQNILLPNNNKTIIEIEFLPNGGRIIEPINANSYLGLKFNSVIYQIEIQSTKNNKYKITREFIKYKTSLKQIYDNNSNIEPRENLDFNLKNFDFNLEIKNNKLLPFNSGIKTKSIDFSLKNGEKISILSEKINPIPFDFLKLQIDVKKTLLEKLLFLFPARLFDYSIYDFDLKKAKESTPITGKSQLEGNGENLAIVIKNILEDKEKARQFSNLMTDILPFIQGLYTEKFYDKSLLFKVKEVYNTRLHVPSSLLSDGTISITAIVAALFFEDKQLTIFEEPEQGVHPALIAKLMSFFYDASNHRQVIITTHSPEILKHIQNLEDLLLISRNENGFGQITRPIEQEMVKAFLENELGIDQLFTQNLLDF